MSRKRTNRLALPLLAILALAVTLSTTLFPTVVNAGPNSPEGKGYDKVASDLREFVRKDAGPKVTVILQLNGSMSGQLNALLRSNGVKVNKHFVNLDAFAVEIPPSVVESLASFPEVSFVSLDSEIRTMGGHVAHTTGADNVRSMSVDGGLDGSGIGIAIIDSGIYASHTSFTDQ